MTFQDKQKIYAALAAPFPESAIQRTEGRVTGRGYNTSGIGYAFITARLNEVVGLGNWRAHRTVTVKEITTAKGRPAFEAICDITLELGEWVDGNFLPWAEALADGGHTSMSEADARKGAYTNALKKAAAMFGCGRQAYEGTLDDDNVPAETVLDHGQEGVTVTTLPTPRPQPSPMVPAPPPSAPAASLQQSRPAVPTRNRLTSKQLSCLWVLGRKCGYDQAGLRAMIKQLHGCQPEFLTRDSASLVISALSKQAGNGHADQFEHAREPGQEG